MKFLPKAKTDNIVVNDLRDELLVYNLTTHQAFTLNETSKIIYQACDGQTSFDDLKRKNKFTDDLIYFALDEFKASDLLVDYKSEYFAGLSRREVVKRVGLASLIALPLISTLVAPTSAAAASGVPTCNDGIKNGAETDVDCGGGTCAPCANGKTCNVSTDCQSNNCVGGVCQSPTCSDGVRNGRETDVDCGGGTCAPCATGKNCLQNSDCASNSCVGGICQ